MHHDHMSTLLHGLVMLVKSAVEYALLIHLFLWEETHLRCRTVLARFSTQQKRPSKLLWRVCSVLEVTATSMVRLMLFGNSIDHH